MTRPQRLAGRIKDWNDTRGFGFVEPNGGGERAFVHIKAFQRGSRRPASGDLVSYLPQHDVRGRLQAVDIRFAGQRAEAPRAPSRFPRAGLGVSALMLMGGAAFAGLIPAVPALVCGLMSGLSYLMYGFDKLAAGRGARRLPESTLHLADLLGGWPGALIAQQQFRHKTRKQPFQAVFWGTVVGHPLLWAWLYNRGI